MPEKIEIAGMSKVSLYLDQGRFREFRIRCLERDQSPSQLIRDFINRTLHEWEQKEKKTK